MNQVHPDAQAPVKSPDQLYRILPGPASITFELHRADGGLSRIEVYRDEALKELLATMAQCIVAVANQPPTKGVNPW